MNMFNCNVSERMKIVMYDTPHKTREQLDRFGPRPTLSKRELKYKSNEQDELHERIIQTGSQISIWWAPEELLGMYRLKMWMVQSNSELLWPQKWLLPTSSKPGIPYEEELLSLLTNKNKTDLVTYLTIDNRHHFHLQLIKSEVCSVSYTTNHIHSPALIQSYWGNIHDNFHFPTSLTIYPNL